MTKNELINRFLKEVSIKSVSELTQFFIDFKNSGGTKEEAIESIAELINHFKDGEPEYDKVLEVSDYVYGWCLPQFRIWD